LTLAAAVSAKAMMIAPPPGVQRVAMADCVVIGKVSSIEAKPVMAARFPGDKEKGEFLIAIVKVDEGLVGANGMTSVRVAFPVPKVEPVAVPVPNPAVPGPRPILRPGRRIPPIKLEADQEACLFLTKHPTEPYFTISAYYNIINKKDNANFDKEMAAVKKAAKLLSDTKAGFASKAAEDRFLTAALLLTRYQVIRPGTMGAPKTEAISPEESKQILLGIADGDWVNNARDPFMFSMNPQAMFNRLQNKTGWTQPKDFKNLPEEAQKWLRANAETYRVQRNVAEK
jgi:hypothetical protein